MAPKSIEFCFVNAFTSSPFGGNPAAIVFLDAPLPEAMYPQIARNFNQPMTSFVLPATGRLYANAQPEEVTDQSTVKTFRLRWFKSDIEIPLCGHATLATAHILFQRPEVPSTVTLLRFETMHSIFTARRSSNALPKERIQIQMPAFWTEPVGNEELHHLKAVVCRAAGKEDMQIDYIGAVRNAEGVNVYVLIELGRNEDLAGIKFNTTIFCESLPFVVNILTKASSQPGITYETRMFAPTVEVPEDHVCGSANCLLGPYWTSKSDRDDGEEMLAKQVSERGGELWVAVNKKEKKVSLSGEGCLFARGSFTVDV